MSYQMTDTQKWHQEYEQLEESNPSVALAINEAYNNAALALQKYIPGFRPAGDDRAEMLVAAITRFYLDSLVK